MYKTAAQIADEVLYKIAYTRWKTEIAGNTPAGQQLQAMGDSVTPYGNHPAAGAAEARYRAGQGGYMERLQNYQDAAQKGRRTGVMPNGEQFNAQHLYTPDAVLNSKPNWTNESLKAQFGQAPAGQAGSGQHVMPVAPPTVNQWTGEVTPAKPEPFRGMGAAQQPADPRRSAAIQQARASAQQKAVAETARVNGIRNRARPVAANMNATGSFGLAQRLPAVPNVSSVVRTRGKGILGAGAKLVRAAF